MLKYWLKTPSACHPGNDFIILFGESETMSEADFLNDASILSKYYRMYSESESIQFISVVLHFQQQQIIIA